MILFASHCEISPFLLESGVVSHAILNLPLSLSRLHRTSKSDMTTSTGCLGKKLFAGLRFVNCMYCHVGFVPRLAHKSAQKGVFS